MSKKKWDFKGHVPKGFTPPQNPTYEDGYAQGIEDALKLFDKYDGRDECYISDIRNDLKTLSRGSR